MDIHTNSTSLRKISLDKTLSVIEKYKCIVGISRIANLTHLDIAKLPVYMAIRPKAKSLSTSQGKGFCDESAKCSAIMESIETYYAENVLPEYKSYSIRDLKGSTFINPNSLSSAINYSCQSIKHHWVSGLTLQSSTKVLIPFAEVSLDTTLNEILIYSPDTTGLASGNNYEEALIHSLFENIERENSIDEFNVSDIQSNYLAHLREFFYLKFIYHLNSYNIPCFECLLLPKNPFENQVISIGKGAHFDKHIAVNRALSEAVQSRVTAISGAREDIGAQKYDYTDSATLPIGDNHISFSDIPQIPYVDVDDALLQLTQLLKQCKKDAVIFTYYHNDICVLKSRIINQSDVNNE